jgi:ABC-type transport system involved in cytochrome c biogenesis permease subunit
LPTSLALVAVAHLVPSSPRSLAFWNLLHGSALLLGMALVVLGSIAGMMYLVQSMRLKRHKLPPGRSMWLPSLERLEKLNERFLIASLGLLGIGLISGVLLNLARRGSQGGVPWSDPVVLASGVWMVWLLVVAVLSGVYRPARIGRKVAYLTTGSFVCLGVVLAIMIYLPSDHANSTAAQSSVEAIPIGNSGRLPP